MNKKILLTLAVAGTVAATFAAKKDPVVMRVAGRDIPRSEFEYLYHKNANQQLQPQTIEEYAEMFKLYKMKVADALEAGIDTTQAFRNEYSGYLVELRAPYTVDSTYVYKLMHEAYDRMQQEVQANHIMLAKPRGIESPKDIYHVADSLLAELKGGADFADLAERFSDDKGSAKRGGSMGYMTVFMTPYEFETAVYDTPEGQYSDIVETDFGYHIIKGGNRRPARGQVLASHILKFVPKDATPEQEAAIKAQMDSIYDEAVKPGASFEALASKFSDDKGSARQGGSVGWFGTGRMVPEFDAVAFSLQNGQISEPFRTDFGYHIVKKMDSKGVPSYKDAEPMLRQAMQNRSDTRGRAMAKQFSDKLAKQYKLKKNDKVCKQMMEYVAQNGLTHEFREHFASMAAEPFMSFADRKYTVGDFLEDLSHYRNVSFPSTGQRDLKKRFDTYESRQLYDYYLKDLPNHNTDFRNLINEYRDGMLLFEISNRKVWDKAAKDTEGLKAFFENNRSDYKWQAPRAKGVLVQAADDSVATRARAILDSLAPAEAVLEIRKELSGKVRADRILMAKGDNQLVDALVFGGPAVDNADSKFPVYFISGLTVIDAPQEVDDVKAQVTADYQNALEAAWVEELQNKYPVEVFEKELKKVK
jgi:peptidyl-prolyl cis-trans isomerase SurA